jgi:hypothetical protein
MQNSGFPVRKRWNHKIKVIDKEDVAMYSRRYVASAALLVYAAIKAV